MDKKTISIVIFIVFFFPLSAISYEAKCISVKDGDSITVVYNGKQIEIRLYGIDAPEVGQIGYSESKVILSKNVYRKKIDVRPKTVDRYGRTVAVVYLEDVNICQIMVASGYAWVDRKYCIESFCNDWLKIEKISKQKKIGLWEKTNPIPPWEYRRK